MILLGIIRGKITPMADIKTTLRELSVIYGLAKHFDGGLRPNFSDFIEVVGKYAKSSATFSMVKRNPDFVSSNRSIIENGVKVAKAIVEVFGFKGITQMSWVGESTHSGTPVDIVVNNVPISLKENSYILENMGLYRMVNILTGSEYSRGELHIFKKFAPSEYEIWFEASWNLLLEQLKQKPNLKVSDGGKSYVSSVRLLDDGVELSYKSKAKSLSVKLGLNCSLNEFERETNPLLREKVFAKWIRMFVNSSSAYLTTKRICAETAGKNLTNLVEKKGKVINMARLFRILDERYYLAKVSRGNVVIFEVPSLQDFAGNFTIKGLEYAVPKSQLNFYTKVTNNLTGDDFILRNEIRFSHGQFNGTPEAKLYTERGSLLGVIYKKVYES